VIAIKQLLEAGVHFGHQTRRWNPKMSDFVFQQRNGIHIVDLQKTIKQIKVAHDYISELVASGGTILFVGTKKQAQEAIKNEAIRCGMPFVSQRWLGGFLTNFSTVSRSLRRLKYLEELLQEPDGMTMKKKERSRLEKEKDRLVKFFGGIRDLKKIPDAMFIIDTKKEDIAVKEANTLGIKIVGIVDTNCDPTRIDYPVPGNDDAIRAINLFVKTAADAVIDGMDKRQDAGEIEGDEGGINNDVAKEMLENSRIELEAEENNSESEENVDTAEETEETISSN